MNKQERFPATDEHVDKSQQVGDFRILDAKLPTTYNPSKPTGFEFPSDISYQDLIALAKQTGPLVYVATPTYNQAIEDCISIISKHDVEFKNRLLEEINNLKKII